MKQSPEGNDQTSALSGAATVNGDFGDGRRSAAFPSVSDFAEEKAINSGFDRVYDHAVACSKQIWVASVVDNSSDNNVQKPPFRRASKCVQSLQIPNGRPPFSLSRGTRSDSSEVISESLDFLSIFAAASTVMLGVRAAFWPLFVNPKRMVRLSVRDRSSTT